LVAESRNHFFNTYEAVVWKDRIVYLAACTKRLFYLLLRCDRRGRAMVNASIFIAGSTRLIFGSVECAAEADWSPPGVVKGRALRLAPQRIARRARPGAAQPHARFRFAPVVPRWVVKWSKLFV
jgi:hypothetical protein